MSATWVGSRVTGRCGPSAYLRDIRDGVCRQCVVPNGEGEDLVEVLAEGLGVQARGDVVLDDPVDGTGRCLSDQPLAHVGLDVEIDGGSVDPHGGGGEVAQLDTPDPFLCQYANLRVGGDARVTGRGAGLERSSMSTSSVRRAASLLGPLAETLRSMPSKSRTGSWRGRHRYVVGRRSPRSRQWDVRLRGMARWLGACRCLGRRSVNRMSSSPSMAKQSGEFTVIRMLLEVGHDVASPVAEVAADLDSAGALPAGSPCVEGGLRFAEPLCDLIDGEEGFERGSRFINGGGQVGIGRRRRIRGGEPLCLSASGLRHPPPGALTDLGGTGSHRRTTCGSTSRRWVRKLPRVIHGPRCEGRVGRNPTIVSRARR